jgi:Beta-galactosidase
MHHPAKRLLALALLALAAIAIAAAPASAAHRRVPHGFFGVVLDPTLPDNGTAAQIDSQMALMASSGVESVRTNFDWSVTEPAPGQYNWTSLDELVGAAARHGLEVLPILEFTPRWASSHPSDGWLFYAPTNMQTFASFATALVGRYGPHGSFWSANPSIPHNHPIRAWQIWNEPEGTKYDWRSTPWPRTYTALLKAAYTAIHGADHGAKVVTGAMVGLNTTTLTPWAETKDLYRAGAGRYFDILAVNAFTNAPSVNASVSRSIQIVQLVRSMLNRNHASHKPIWVTELTWTAAKGKIPPSAYAGFETTSAGQSNRLAGYYTRIATHSSAGIQRAFWYTWATAYVPQALFGNPPTFQYSGLVKWQPGQPFVPLPVLSTYARVAARFEGCRHNTAGQCR